MTRRTKRKPNPQSDTAPALRDDSPKTELEQGESSIVSKRPRSNDVRSAIMVHLRSCEMRRRGRAEAEAQALCPHPTDPRELEWFIAALEETSELPIYGDTCLGIVMAIQERFPQVSDKDVRLEIECLRKESMIWRDDDESKRCGDAVWRPTAKGSLEAEILVVADATPLSKATSGMAQKPPTGTDATKLPEVDPPARHNTTDDSRAVVVRGGVQAGEAVTAEAVELASAPSGPAPLGTEQDAWLGYAAIARANGVGVERLRKRLERLRRTNHNCFREVADGERKPREPRFLYRLSMVDPIVRDLKASGGASAQRPAKKS